MSDMVKNKTTRIAKRGQQRRKNHPSAVEKLKHICSHLLLRHYDLNLCGRELVNCIHARRN